jgi:hypothetical protein
MTTESNRGKFVPVPLTFTVDGVESTYAGRGRFSAALATLCVREKKLPVNKDGGWTWVDASTEDLAKCQALVDKTAAAAKAAMEKAAAKAAAKAAKAAAKSAPKETVSA